METKHGHLQVIITDDYAAMSARAAEIIAARVGARPDMVLGLATGSTPVGTYDALIARHKAGALDFSRLTAFNLDEYHRIKRDDVNSYAHFMRRHLFNHVNIDSARAHIPNGEADDVLRECADYEARIAGVGGIDLQLLGLGLNGHIGFNEPHETLPAVTHYVALDESTIEANSRFFNSADQVPRHALTMGIGTIMHAKEILLLISGEAKAHIAKQLLEGPITPRVPGSILRLHQNTTVVLDRAAAVGIGH